MFAGRFGGRFGRRAAPPATRRSKPPAPPAIGSDGSSSPAREAATTPARWACTPARRPAGSVASPAGPTPRGTRAPAASPLLVRRGVVADDVDDPVAAERLPQFVQVGAGQRRIAPLPRPALGEEDP